MIKIEEGKSYRARNGKRWLNARKNTDRRRKDFPWELRDEVGRRETFTDDGMWTLVSSDFPQDLIAEWTEEPAPETDALAAAQARIVELEAKIALLRDAAIPLAARLMQWASDNITDENASDWFGHVVPALNRLNHILAFGEDADHD